MARRTGWVVPGARCALGEMIKITMLGARYADATAGACFPTTTDSGGRALYYKARHADMTAQRAYRTPSQLITEDDDILCSQ